jgi:hypothetical protein
MHVFMMNVFQDQKKISKKEVRQRFACKWKKCLTEVVPLSPLFRESFEMQAQHRTMVEISKMRGQNTRRRKKERQRRRVSWRFLSVKSTRQLMDFAAEKGPWKTTDPKAPWPLKT